MQGAQPYHRVLLIDDSSLDIFVNSRIIKKNNFATVIHSNNSAEEGIEFLKSIQAACEAPVFIFLDLMMPTMDGFGFLSEFEKLNDLIKDNCRIVVLSSSVNPTDIDLVNNNKYVVKFVSKPLSTEALSSLSI
jgi:CheY-like chemotaxis protein